MSSTVRVNVVKGFLVLVKWECLEQKFTISAGLLHRLYLTHDRPGLLISVIGGNKSFHAPHDVCLHFQHGLLNAAKSTNGWIITSGQDEVCVLVSS